MSEEGRILVAGGPVDRRTKYMLTGMTCFVIGAGLMFGWVFKRQHDVSVTNCRQIEVVKHGLFLTLKEAEAFASSSPVRSPAEKAAVVMFYADALGRLRPRECH